MLSFESAYQLVLEQTPHPEPETVGLLAAVGHVLAEPLVADMDVPPFDRAVMDGFALRSADSRDGPFDLKIIGEVAAGSISPLSVAAGQAVQIMTGAAVPAGADAIEMIEVCDLKGQSVQMSRRLRAGERIAAKGSEVAQDQVVLEAGRLIGAAETALLAMFGKTQVAVYRRPSVAILATGDELVPPSTRPGPGQIRNSNSYALAAQLKLCGIEAELLGAASDRVEDLREKIAGGLQKDLLLLTGGVSAGKYDLVAGVLQALGVEIFFDRLAVKPGKPVTFGRKGTTLVFGLPGNPVSAYVSFETLVVPSIRKRAGFRLAGPFGVAGRLEASIRNPGDRALFAPARVWYEGGWRIAPIETRGSADIFRFSTADALVYLEKDVTSLDAGAEAVAYLLPDYLNRRAQTKDQGLRTKD
ncbi:MAG: molybdopterin molybdotransferase MoeA [Acidobacteriota bacterium]